MTDEKLIVANHKRRRTRVEVYVINKEKTHILTHIRSDHEFDEFPAGGVDVGETLIDAAIRELQEESGWIAKNYTLIDLGKRYIWSGKEYDDLTKYGWDEEEQIPVICEGVGFFPNEKYGQEGDTFPFLMVPITDVIESTKKFISTNTDERFAIKAQCRLDVLLTFCNQVISETPDWTKW